MLSPKKITEELIFNFSTEKMIVANESCNINKKLAKDFALMAANEIKNEVNGNLSEYDDHYWEQVEAEITKTQFL